MKRQKKGIIQSRIVVLLLWLICLNVHAQELVFDWLQNTSDENEIVITDCIFDQDGNILVTGNVPVSKSDSIQAKSNIHDYAQLIKFNAEGARLWSKDFTSDNHIEISHIIKSCEGFYITGLLMGEVNIEGTIVSNKNRVTFIARFDEQAKCIWVKTLGGVIKNPIVIDIEKNVDWVYLSGVFSKEFQIADTTIGNGSFQNILLAKIDKTEGKTLDYSFFSCTKGLLVADGISINHGQIILAGSFEGCLKTGKQTKISNGESDCYILKLDTNLYPISCTAFGGYYKDYISSIECFDSSMYLCGAFTDEITIPDGSAIISNGRLDVFMSKMDDNAEFISTTSFGGATNDYPNNLAYIDGEIYISGTSRGLFKADTESKGIPLSETALTFLAKLNKDNNLSRTWYFRGEDFSLGRKLLIEKSGEIILTGSYNNKLNTLEGKSLSTDGAGSFISRLINCTEKDQVKIKITEKSCDHFKLSAEGNMKDYLWSSTSNASEISVDSTSWYFLKARDYRNCPSIDSVFVQLGDSLREYETEEWVVSNSQVISLFAPENMESYNWSNGSKNASLTINSDTLSNNNSTICVAVVDSLGCAGRKYFLIRSSGFYKDEKLSPSNPKNTYSIDVFPNPCHNWINLYVFGETLGSIIDVRLISSEGATLLQEDIKITDKQTAETFNISPYPSGHYILSVESKKRSRAIKIVIEK